MALILTLSTSLSYTGNNIVVADSVSGLAVTVNNPGLLSLAAFTVPTTAAAIPLGSISVPGGWLYVKNTDATNYMTLITGTGGVTFARLYPGEFAHFRIDAGLTAPFWKANVATVQAVIAFFDN